MNDSLDLAILVGVTLVEEDIRATAEWIVKTLALGWGWLRTEVEFRWVATIDTGGILITGTAMKGTGRNSRALTRRRAP